MLGKSWDSDRGGRDKWIKWLAERLKEAQRLLKPGAHGVIWSLPRTSHWTATAVEDAGFQIVDVISHHFARSLPKQRNSLKPTTEFWHVIRKPISEATSKRTQIAGESADYSPRPSWSAI